MAFIPATTSSHHLSSTHALPTSIPSRRPGISGREGIRNLWLEVLSSPALEGGDNDAFPSMGPSESASVKSSGRLGCLKKAETETFSSGYLLS